LRALDLSANRCADKPDVRTADLDPIDPQLGVDQERHAPADQGVDELRLGRTHTASSSVTYRSAHQSGAVLLTCINDRQQLLRRRVTVRNRAEHDATNVSQGAGRARCVHHGAFRSCKPQPSAAPGTEIRPRGCPSHDDATRRRPAYAIWDERMRHRQLWQPSKAELVQDQKPREDVRCPDVGGRSVAEIQRSQGPGVRNVNSPRGALPVASGDRALSRVGRYASAFEVTRPQHATSLASGILSSLLHRRAHAGK
ncbi:MAG: hypothetical protein JWO88_3013, partial [Frankiales bacterium]|nr:hypothetical protein [Frankiales bacterium]